MNYGNPNYINQFRSDMEKQAITQAQDFLSRYGIKTNNPEPAAAPLQQANQETAGTFVTIGVANSLQAENAPIDAFRTFIYPNTDGGEIYVKKIGAEGTAVMQTFLPKGQEQIKSLEDILKKMYSTMAYLDERMKAIENSLTGNITNKEKETNNGIEQQ